MLLINQVLYLKCPITGAALSFAQNLETENESWSYSEIYSSDEVIRSSLSALSVRYHWLRSHHSRHAQFRALIHAWPPIAELGCSLPPTLCMGYFGLWHSMVGNFQGQASRDRRSQVKPTFFSDLTWRMTVTSTTDKDLPILKTTNIIHAGRCSPREVKVTGGMVKLQYIQILKHFSPPKEYYIIIILSYSSSVFDNWEYNRIHLTSVENHLHAKLCGRCWQ